MCDQARQACPVFPGVHESLHWGYEDPAAVEGTEEERLAAFRAVFIQLGERVAQFAVLAQRQASAAGLMLLHLLRHAHAGDPYTVPGTGQRAPADRQGPGPGSRGSAASWPTTGS